MRVGVLLEHITDERRVAVTPESAKQLIAAGLDVLVEAGAGAKAGHADSAYTQAGATVENTVDPSTLDVLCHVRPLPVELVARLKQGAVTVGLASASTELATVKALAQGQITSFALELVPRISRAQSMDALTSQSLITGYRAVLEGATRFSRFFPLYMTAAGTIPPARALVLGAGVAGLQAIGTAKRLGARVSAYDVRPASADEVTSMGGTFVHLNLDAVEGQGGYAKELSEDRTLRQQQLLAPYVADADVLITTAAIPGRAAPLLVTTEMVAGMRAGSVIIDLAAETGGNVEGVEPGVDKQVPTQAGDGVVTLYGLKDAASDMATDASRLYAKNVSNLIELMTDEGTVAPDFDDELVAGACLTHDGQVRHAPTAAALEEN